MTPDRWFLPHSPDVLGALQAQATVTVEGMDALAAWASGEAAAADRVRECEHLADHRKRELRAALSEAFITPLEPEDLFELSRGLDLVMDAAKNTVREAEVMSSTPDGPMAELATALAAGTRRLADALAALARSDSAAASAAADAAHDSQRSVEHTYRSAMSALVAVDDLHEVAARRELYRRLARSSDHLRDVAERVWYSLLKES